STSSAEQGAKAKELDISGLIPFKEERMLSRLFELADTKGDGGKRHVYRVGSLLAKSVKVRQAKFAGRITASEQEGLLAWQVQFTLKEFNSVPEKREARLPGNPANIGKGSPGTAAATAGGNG
uniref:baseplate complex protein n=1 Tax=Aeromonas popoffii TaxID=70856 RepID=UPI0020125181